MSGFVCGFGWENLRSGLEDRVRELEVADWLFQWKEVESFMIMLSSLL